MMVAFMFNAVIVLFCLFVVILILSLMTWVIVKVLRALFPNRFISGKRTEDEV